MKIDNTSCDHGRGQFKKSRDRETGDPVCRANAKKTKFQNFGGDSQIFLFYCFLLEVEDFHQPLIRKQVLRGAYAVRRHFVRWGCVSAKTRFAS